MTPTKQIFTPALLGLAVLVSACDGSVRPPTSAGALPAAPTPAAIYTLSGVVSEQTSAGPAPVEGVRVEETSSHRFVMTDASGAFSISGLTTSNAVVTVSKPGYVSSTRSVTGGGDTQVDISVARVTSYTLSGVVFEVTPEGRTPIEGVEVYCDGCGSPVGHTFAVTGVDGVYSFGWTYNGANPLFVTKAGYAIADPTGTESRFYGV